MVRRVATEFGVGVSIVDVDDDPDLRGRYTDRVPVVLGPGGRVVAEGNIDEHDLRTGVQDDLSRLA
jgi:hypothetical protein